VVDPAIVEGLVARSSRLVAELSDRQREILQFVAQGLSNDEIGTRVGASGDAVDGEIDDIFAALGLPDECEEDRRVAAVLTYLRETAMR
jgi:DNA-binding NarL/FixJ family response regulator